jgi:hypothetical protein
MRNRHAHLDREKSNSLCPVVKLLNRNPDRRLGMMDCPAGDVTVQPFFYGINWSQADAKQMRPPFIPDLVRFPLNSFV